MQVGASDRSSSVAEEIEGGLISGVLPFEGEVGYHTPRLWVCFQIVMGIFLCAQVWLQLLAGLVKLCCSVCCFCSRNAKRKGTNEGVKQGQVHREPSCKDG